MKPAALDHLEKMEISTDLSIAENFTGAQQRRDLVAPDHLEKMEIPTRLSAEETQTNAQQLGNLVQEYERKIEQLPEDQQHYPNYVLMRVGSLSNKDNISILLIQKKDHRCNIYAENYTMPRNEKGTRIRGWILKNTRIGPVLNIKSLLS